MATKTKAPKDAIALLKEDHAAVRKLLDELEEAAMHDGSEAGTLLETIEAELKVHTTIEEELFYPAFREAASRKDDTKLYYEAVEEHHVVDMVLPEMDKGEVGSPEFAAKAKVLKDLVEHHAGEEEKEMFPRTQAHGQGRAPDARRAACPAQARAEGGGWVRRRRRRRGRGGLSGRVR
jgi:hemerythrin superfamily protein